MWRTSWGSHANAQHVEAVEQLDQPGRPVGVVQVHDVDPRFGEMRRVALDRIR